MTNDELINEVYPDALGMVTAVRDDPAEVHRILRRLDTRELYALAVLLAAMVPDDATPGALLSWTDWGPPTEMGSARLRSIHAAYQRGERDEQTRRGEREYQRRRKSVQRQAMSA